MTIVRSKSTANAPRFGVRAPATDPAVLDVRTRLRKRRLVGRLDGEPNPERPARRHDLRAERPLGHEHCDGLLDSARSLCTPWLR